MNVPLNELNEAAGSEKQTRYLAGTDPNYVIARTRILESNRTSHFPSLARARAMESGNVSLRGLTPFRPHLDPIYDRNSDPKAEAFSWFHRQKFEEELDWRKRLTENN